MNEDQLAKQFEAYRKLASEDKRVDVAALAIDALQKTHINSLTVKEKRWGYLTSVALPPFGLLFAAKFYFSGKDDGQESAWICGILTAVSILFFVLMLKLFVSGSGVSLNQIEQIKPTDVQQLIQ